MKLHIHGVHVPNRKNTAELAALRRGAPPQQRNKTE